MKTLLGILAAICGGLSIVSAQVTVEVVLPQERFLPAEELLAGVRVVNRSGQTLRLGEETNWIRFSIQAVDGGFVRRLSDPPVEHPFDLESAKQATLKVDLAPHYDLRRAGKYTISADVTIKDWDRSLATKPVNFEIIEGTKLWEQAFGVPRPGGQQPPELRSYALQQANHLTEPRLYLRVSRADGSVIKLINMGRMLAFGSPEPMLDALNRLHLLHQTGARSSEYWVVNPEGEIEIRQLYEYAGTRPRLRMDENGQVQVTGGMRRKSANDLPVEVEKKNGEDKVENSQSSKPSSLE
jgi:hypothetical protein